ncbi:DUF1840 domain-containing protein [Caballeronia sp. LZ035]|uniref:DUF1840 domain-containing protein n=1 Tax=Caballeronia sp. LZ035 TaxID=3038568 RepID=UPI00285BFFA1|nr:DUF1840 domain-containing protein [Caballeronia sp. LZ035]MDR5759469.1 DUF1840 domain-containing protein [Caballeronia sp. LZ035]
MLVTFHSKATPDVVMLKDLAGYLLGVIGKRIDVRGVIIHADVAAAIGRLEAALDEDARIAEEHGATHRVLSGRTTNHDAGLRQRAVPFIDMLRMANQQHADILWSC